MTVRNHHPTGRPKDVLVLALILIVFGAGEVWVGLFGNYLGILSKALQPSAATAVVGSFYCLAGVMLLITRRRWGAILSLIFIGLEVLGRAYLVLIGVAPASGPDLVKIIIGGVIAVGFMFYIGLRCLDRSDASPSDP